MAESFITPEALSERIAGLERLLSMQFSAYQTAIKVAFDSNNERLLVMNHFREDINRLTNTLLPRQTFDDKNAGIEKKFNEQAGQIKELELLKANITGRIWGVTAILIAAMFILKFLIKG